LTDRLEAIVRERKAFDKAGAAPSRAAGAVDAKNAPTAPWKTTEQFSTSFHTQHLSRNDTGGDISNE